MNACLLHEIHQQDVIDYMKDNQIDTLTAEIDELVDFLWQIKQNPNNKYSINALTTLRF